jgi:probable phosphoglycerate mutase
VPTRVFVLRHAESADPTVFHGAESDIALSECGRRQAEALAPILAAHAPAAVISSAMRRARDTAAPIAAACGLPVLVEPQLHERRVGALSGTPFATSDGTWPETLRWWMAGHTAFAPSDSESFDDIRERVWPVWERLTRTYDDHCFVVVAHGVVCKVLFLSLLPGHSSADWQRLGPIRNAALTELEGSDGRWQVRQFNALPEAVAALSRQDTEARR